MLLVSEDVVTFNKHELWEDGEIRVEAPEVLDSVEFARTRLKFEPDERQIEVLRSEAKRGILNCTRQWGKSTVAAAKAVHRAFTRPKSLVLVASPAKAERGVDAESGGDVRTAGHQPRGDGDNELRCCSERVSHCRAARDREHGARVFGRFAAAY